MFHSSSKSNIINMVNQLFWTNHMFCLSSNNSYMFSNNLKLIINNNIIMYKMMYNIYKILHNNNNHNSMNNQHKILNNSHSNLSLSLVNNNYKNRFNNRIIWVEDTLFLVKEKYIMMEIKELNIFPMKEFIQNMKLLRNESAFQWPNRWLIITLLNIRLNIFHKKNTKQLRSISQYKERKKLSIIFHKKNQSFIKMIPIIIKWLMAMILHKVIKIITRNSRNNNRILLIFMKVIQFNIDNNKIIMAM